ncbi:MAG TPA: sterol desaturase family protein [Gammaproteobacteria bacterium]
MLDLFLAWFGVAIIPVFLVIDLIWRAKRHHRARFWRLRAAVVTVAAIYVSLVVAGFWGGVLGDFHLLDLSGWGTWGGALAGVLAYEFGHYWYHRAVHRFDLLWRLGHQMHHSAESLDPWGAYYMHPLDVACFTTVASFMIYPLLGITSEAGIAVAAFIGFNAIFQHASIPTPRWLGYLIQRPESHSLHHARGVHRYNFSDLPLWDMIFGTFRNPETFRDEQGFYDGASTRLVEVLLFQDVSKPKEPPAT